MDFFRRLHQSYPPRPSPLSNSQASRDDRDRERERERDRDRDRPRSHVSSSISAANSAAAAAAAAATANTPTVASTIAANESRNRPDDKIRVSNRYEFPPPTSSHQHQHPHPHPHPFLSSSRGLHRSRRDTAGPGAHISPPRNHAHQHRRHASMETRQQGHVHRRNHSQPQTGHLREGQEQSAPPAFGTTRQMPPPSPPHAYSSRSQSANAPASSLFSREIPGGHAHRPGSSMSISSMLGSDPERPARDSGSLFSRPSPVFGNAPTPASAAAAMSPPSAPARQSPLDQSLFRRSNTPEKSFSKPPLGRPYRSGSGGGSSLLGDSSKFGGLSRPSSHSQYPEKPHSTHPSPKVSPAESSYNEPRRMSFSGPIARSNSQPPNAEAAGRPPGYSPISRTSGGAGDRLSYGGVDLHARDHAREQSRFGGLYGERRSEETASRDRDRLGLGQEAKGSLARYGSIYGDRDHLDRHSSASNWDHGRSHPSSPETKRLPAFESGSGFGFGAIQSYTKSLGSQPGGARQPPLSLQTGQGQPTPSPRESPYLSNKQPSSQPQRQGSTPATASSAGLNALGLASASDDGRRKGSDELLAHRNLLAIGADGKRGGRASPLPQAVQGAQAPFIGATGEPSIKNELGRVFSGIGSGVGGVTAGVSGMSGVSGSGPSTPLISSPFKRDSFTGRSTNGETDDSKIARPPSASGTRRSRKSRDEDMQMELESGSGLSARGGRRARPHHHHHHHHHHRHKPDEEASSALAGLHRPLSSTNYFNQNSTSSEAPVHPHHHHHHHHRHHHHPPQPAPAPPLREPRTTVNLEPLLSSVSHLPRHHLGSTLYTPRIDVPSTKASAESSKFGYTTTPQPLPRFEQRENCTFTVRVPRFRIDTTHREEICARRALWGTGVYTDDSDPVAAAIHSGFIRGAWGDDVDESMLDLEIKDTYQHAPPREQARDSDTNGAFKEGSANEARLPPIPPPNQDLHITLLILPRLENYDGAIMFGIKSRKWKGRHDGMSFKVQRVEWVDEGVARGEERSGEARRKRLRTLMQTGRICTGPAMAKMDELRRSGVQVPRTIDGQEQPTPVQPVS